ncbi:MAG: dihydrofolate reductase [Chitinophagales bacterium]
MKFSIIVAASENHVIGYKGDMPWPKMKGDLKWFKEKTMGKWCILGRKSYNSLGNKVLPGRKFIIVTRDKGFVSEDSIVVNDVQDAMQHPVLKEETEVMVLGGGEIYKQVLHFVNRIYLTKIHAHYDGDTFFPELKTDEWILASAQEHPADEKNPHAYSFLIYEKK